HYMMLSCTPWSDDRISEIPGPYLPIFSVNKTVGEFLVNQGVNSDNTISGYIDQVYYEGTTPSNGIDAYDIVGHINIPKSPEDKIVVISNRQDSWWGECPGDSGAGAGIVLGIAKYFKEHDITPKYNLTFLQTTGEELQMRGAYFYSDNHSEDNIFLFIGTDQLGMEQPGSYLNLNYKSDSTRRIVYAITNETHYVQRTKYQINNTPAFADNAPDNAPGSNWGDSTDDHVWKRRDMYDNSNPCDTIVVNKENWTSHHQTGLNFNEGDSLKNTNRSDLNITFELFWNITKYFCVNPDCEFENLVFTEFDSPADGDTLLDSIRADFSINSVLPNDKVMVNATLCDQNNNGAVVAWKVTNYTITTLSQSHPYNITITIPDTDAQGEYSLQLRLYNSTGRINKIIDSDDDEPNEIQNSDSFHLYHPFGNPTPGNLYHSTEDIIRGSYFTANEYGTARNITAYVQANTSGTSVHSVCMIYRKNDSKLIGRTVEILPATGRTPQWRIYNFTTPYPVLEEGTEYVLVCWSDGLCNLYYDHIPLTTRGRYDSHTYGVPPDPAVFIPDTSLYSIYCGYRNDTNPPWVTNITENPHTVGFGGNVTISADVVDNESGVNTVTVNIGYPGGRAENKMMTLKSGDTYQYVFNNTWLVGQYNYTIWATDNANNTSNHYDRHHFHVSADASISIATLQDSYSGNQYINITDPPNIPENYTVVNRGLTWDEYYNAITGQNILEVSTGPVNYQEDNGTWTPINNTISQLAANHPAYVYGYRNGNNHGLYGAYFKSNAQNEWPVAFTYNRSDDPTTYVIRSKLVGVGYVDPQSNWAYQYLQNIQSSQGQFTGNTITYEDVFTGTDVTWSYGNTGLKEEITLSNTTKTLLQNHPPSQYGFNDASSYLVFITKLDHQSLNLYNSSGLLDGNVTISDNGVEFRDMLGQFKCALPLGEAYESNNESVRQRLTYRIVRYHDETYLLSGLRVTDLNSMTFPVVIDPTITINVSSSSDERGNYNSNYQTAWSATTSNLITDPYIVIGQRKASNIYMIHRGFVFIDTSSLPANAVIDDSVLSLYKYSDSSTTDFSITIQNGQPTYPHDPLQTSDYNKALYSGDGGKLNTASLVNGYNNISLNSTGLGWINRTGWTKLCLRSSRDISGIAPTGNEYVTFYSSTQGSATIPKLIITYRNQSKIKNTGSTDIKGYLLIQVQFYETGKGVAPRWVVDNDTVNETSPRIINSGSQLGLDTVFNGKIRTSNLQHGTGTYRVYTAFRDPEGTILRTNDGTELKAWWQFSKT
ncbi:MAG TPA: M28 family peptidase, partial [Candidatus Thermoplasmatota archaeon]|nr:M28 family peptidase [Candidatus Thermoplasmatota archaeon]